MGQHGGPCPGLVDVWPGESLVGTVPEELEFPQAAAMSRALLEERPALEWER